MAVFGYARVHDAPTKAETMLRDTFARSPGDLASRGDLRYPRMPRRFSYYKASIAIDADAMASSIMSRQFVSG
jgi:hypothetical protein